MVVGEGVSAGVKDIAKLDTRLTKAIKKSPLQNKGNYPAIQAPSLLNLPDRKSGIASHATVRIPVQQPQIDENLIDTAIIASRVSYMSLLQRLAKGEPVSLPPTEELEEQSANRQYLPDEKHIVLSQEELIGAEIDKALDERVSFQKAKQEWLAQQQVDDMVTNPAIPDPYDDDRTDVQSPFRDLQPNLYSPDQLEWYHDVPKYIPDTIYQADSEITRVEFAVRTPSRLEPDKTGILKKVERPPYELQVISVDDSYIPTQSELFHMADLKLAAMSIEQSPSLETAFGVVKYITDELSVDPQLQGHLNPAVRALIAYQLLHSHYHFTNLHLVQGEIRIIDEDGPNHGPSMWIEWHTQTEAGMQEKYYIDPTRAPGIEDFRRYKNYSEYVMRRGGFYKEQINQKVVTLSQ